MTVPEVVTLRAALEATASGDAEAIEALYAEDCIGWVAGRSVNSLQELLDEARTRRDALSDVKLDASTGELTEGQVAAEWRLMARHTGPLHLDDEFVVPPTGRQLDLRGAMFAEVTNGKIISFRQYWDPADLLEQLGLLTEEEGTP